MPEGDTVHRHAAQLGPLLVGVALEKVLRRGATLGSLAGAKVLSVEARGKHLLVALDNRYVLHVHLGINGRWRVTPRAESEAWSWPRADLALVTAGHVFLAKARTVEVLQAAFARAHPRLAALGPDLLTPTLDLAAVLARARAAPDRALSLLLLDQRIAAGIGNVYKSELMFLEKLHPATRVSQLDDATLTRVYARAREVMSKNLGPWPRTTSADRTSGELPPAGMGRTWVYDRRGRPCYECATIIEGKIEGEQLRQTFWCPRCQPDVTRPS